MAESKRRGEDAADDHLDEVFADAVDDGAPAEFDDDFIDDDQPGSTAGRRSSSTATKAKANTKSLKPAEVNANAGLFERIARFVREVVAELRKVNWPSRHELITYTTVVIVFVVIMMLIVSGLDWLFGWLVTHVFG